jgi:hypothetical protein
MDIAMLENNPLLPYDKHSGQLVSNTNTLSNVSLRGGRYDRRSNLIVRITALPLVARMRLY